MANEFAQQLALLPVRTLSQNTATEDGPTFCDRAKRTETLKKYKMKGAKHGNHLQCSPCIGRERLQRRLRVARLDARLRCDVAHRDLRGDVFIRRNAQLGQL